MLTLSFRQRIMSALQRLVPVAKFRLHVCMEAFPGMKSMTGHLRQQVSRLIAVALLLALAISFVACGGQEEPKKSGQFKMNQGEYYGGL